MVDNLAAVRAAVIQGAALALEFQTATASFYVAGNTTPVLVTSCRMKKPKPSAFDSGNQTEWQTRRGMILRIPMDVGLNVIEKGLIVQVSTPDGDPTINHINFVVQSALSSQFAAERSITCVSEVVETPRVV